MTHPADKVYRFSSLAHWGRGLAENLLFDIRGDGGVLRTAVSLSARHLARAPRGVEIATLAADPCGRLLWLLTDGTLMTADEGRAVQVAKLSGAQSRDVRRLIWGQRTGWLAAGGSLIRIDTESGDSTGTFDAATWQVADAVADHCDGVIVAETNEDHLRFRKISADGRARVLARPSGVFNVIAALRPDHRANTHLLSLPDNGVLRVAAFEPDGSPAANHTYPGLKPSGPVTMDGSGRIILATDAGMMSLSAGLSGPIRRITSDGNFGQITSLLWANGTLFAATRRRVWMLDDCDTSDAPQNARYFSPALRSPLGDRSGWLRADLFATLPDGARARISCKPFPTQLSADAYDKALRTDPTAAVVREGWSERTASEHFGDGQDGPLRTHLGDETAEFIALRIELSLPAGRAAAIIRRLDVLYPNRSLIDDLPAIYRTGTSGEAQFRRMLAPFQVLVDGIDDRIGEGAQRADPGATDDLWTGFLLGWLGHGDLARLPAQSRRKLLRALPEILPLRGTIAGLVQVMECLAPEGFLIEDSAARPDWWILPKPGDPAGPRLGRETPAAGHLPGALVLGECTPLGSAVLKHGCLDLGSLSRCSAAVTVRVFGGAAAEARLAPFVDHIARHFAPANTRIGFVFGDHRPERRLERAAGRDADHDPDALSVLDDSRSRALGAWRLPRGAFSKDRPPVLDQAHLDGGLILH